MTRKAAPLRTRRAKTPDPSPSKQETAAARKVEPDPRITARLKDNANRTARLLYAAGQDVGDVAASRLFLAKLEKLGRERNRLLLALGYPKSLLKGAASKP